jgi:iron complex outermembrane receptor protein
MNRRMTIAALLLLRGTASADEETAPAETIIVIDRKPDSEAARDRDRALGDAPFVTVVHAEDHPATTSVADALGSTVGVHTRSLGGLGAYQSISVRGAAPGHTSVLVDGVPLARLAAVTTDLGRYTLDAFGEVELYRGAVPLELGGAGVGGALNLVTRLGRGDHGELVHISTGAGSYGARHLRARYGDRFGDIDTVMLAGYQAAAGDYTFFQNAGTDLNLKDDTYETRTNNGFSQVDVVTRAGRVDRSLVGGARLAWRSQGIPGDVQDPTLDPYMSTLDVLADARGDVDVGRATARHVGYFLVENQRLRDPENELKLGAQNRAYLTLSGGASSTWTVPFGAHRLAAGVELRGDRFRDADRMNERDTLIGDREGGAVMADLDIALDPTVVITPAMRLDVVRTVPVPVGIETTEPDLPTHYDTIPSPRLSARLAVNDDVAIKTSAGWYVRLPTLLELFGNRGAVLGRPDLRPERGPSSDFGVVWAPAVALGGFDRFLVEASVFGTRNHDTIVFIHSVGPATRPENVANAQTYGGELVATARVARTVSVTANYTRLVTENISEDPGRNGKQLPGKPGHEFYARADVVHDLFGRQVSAWLDASWLSTSYQDQPNSMAVPARFLAGTGARIELAGGLAASVAVENLANVRIEQYPLDPPPRADFTQTPKALADVAGFPLPGRSLYVSLEWSR